MLQGRLIATLAVEQHPSIVCALLLSGPALDVDPAFGSFSFSVLVRNNREMLTHLMPSLHTENGDSNDKESAPAERTFKS